MIKANDLCPVVSRTFLRMNKVSSFVPGTFWFCWAQGMLLLGQQNVAPWWCASLESGLQGLVKFHLLSWVLQWPCEHSWANLLEGGNLAQSLPWTQLMVVTPQGRAPYLKSVDCRHMRTPAETRRTSQLSPV